LPDESDVFPGFLFEPVPDSQCLLHHRNLAGIATLDSNPAPVATRLFTSNMPFLTKHDADTLPRQEPGCRYTDYAATDDNNVSLTRDLLRWLKWSVPG
jgi:hypothetical protein